MLDVRLRLLASASRPLRSRSRVRLHLGTAEALARVVLLATTELAPGGSAFAQMRIETPLLALPGDHFIIRRSSPMATIGGGIVLDPLPKKHRVKDGAATIAWLARLENADETERIGLFVEMAGEAGLVEAEIAARSGASDAAIARAVETLLKSRRLIQAGESPRRFVARSAFDELGKQTRQLLKEYHQRAPLEAGMPREELRERLFSRLHPDLFRAVIANAATRNELIAERDLIRLATHRVELSPQEKAAKDRLAEIFLHTRLNPSTLEEAIADACSRSGIDPQKAQKCAQMLINSGELVRVGDLVFHRQALEELKGILRNFKAEHGTKIDISVFKDLIGVSRKYAIPLLEYLDRQRVTRRAGDGREIL